jgi:alginate O-acetyltransferase complex protein AlgJ
MFRTQKGRRTMTAGSTTVASEDRRDLASPHTPSPRNLLIRILAALFLLALFVPLVGTILHWDVGNASNEKRRLAEIPTLPKNSKALSQYSDDWLNFYRDHFGFRNALIHSVAEARYYGIGPETGSGDVLVGKQGWLYLRPDGDHNLIAFRGLNPLTEAELDVWQNLFEKRQAYLASLGIPYLVVVAPDKQTIYPEYLPDEYKIVRPVSRLDQLIDRLKKTHSPVQIVDLRPTLLAAKSSQLVYHRTDTHWNDFGAYAGYRVIMDAVQKALPQWHIPPQPLDNFTVTPDVPEVGDLAIMIDAPDRYPDHGKSLVRKIPIPNVPQLVNRNQVVTMDMQNPSRPRLLLYRDSFGIALVPMLGPDFDQTTFAFLYAIDPQLIRKIKPNIVINEFIERNLCIAPPADAPELRDWKPN